MIRYGDTAHSAIYNMHFFICVVILLCCLLSCYPIQVPPLSTELGCSPTISILCDRERYKALGGRPFFYFDPLNLATDSNFARLREAELKHCRVAMLAMAEIILIPFLKQIQVVPHEFPEGFVVSLPRFQQSDLIEVSVSCCILELFVFIQRDALDMPGDYSTGYFGLRDKTSHEISLVAELENGRLAMIGFVCFLVSDVLTNGQPWSEQWMLLLEKAFESQE